MHIYKLEELHTNFHDHILCHWASTMLFCSNIQHMKTNMNWRKTHTGYQLPPSVESKLSYIRNLNTLSSCSQRASPSWGSWGRGSLGWSTRESGQALLRDHFRWLSSPSTGRRRRAGTNCSKRQPSWDSSTTHMWSCCME